ncbi:hypothetical protein BC831DRAFT_466582 [Entophlyctis helioformis]|nr:hypothetical protein BC831DRAFT_466582 [Entophlyctis helioformis]
MLERLLADSDGNRDEWPDEQSHASQDYQRRHRSPSRQCTDLRPSLARVLGACLAVVVLLGLLFHLWDAAVPQRASMQPSIASRFAEAARSRQDRRLPMQPPLSDPSPGLFSITEGLHVLNSITTLNLTVVGSAVSESRAGYHALPDLPTSPATPPIHLPPSISFSYLVESTQEHLDPSAPLIISSSVSGSTAVIHVTSPVGSIIDQLAIGSSLGIPLSKTPLTLNLNIDNGAVRFAAFNASFAFGSVAVHVDTGLIDTNVGLMSHLHSECLPCVHAQPLDAIVSPRDLQLSLSGSRRVLARFAPLPTSPIVCMPRQTRAGPRSMSS